MNSVFGATRSRFVAIFIFCASLISLAFLIHVSQRGFDIADEGYILLASRFPMDVDIWANVAHVYLGMLLHLVGYNVVGLRVLSEILMFCSASIFFVCLLRLVSAIFPTTKYKNDYKIITWSVMCLGTLFYYVFFVLTPSYNTLNSMLLNIASGLVCLSLIYMDGHSANSRLSILSAFVTGLFIGVMLFVKFPTALALFFVFSLTFFTWPQVNMRNRIWHVAMLFLGAGAWVLFHIAFLQSWASLSRTMVDGIYLFTSYGHQPSHCLQRYFQDAMVLIWHAVKYFWVSLFMLLLGVIASYVGFKKANNIVKIQGVCVILLLVIAAGNAILLQFYRGGATQWESLMAAYTGWLLLLVFSYVATVIYQKKLLEYKNSLAAKRLLILSLFLFVLPFAGAFGTANPITMNMTQYMSAWFGLIVLLLLLLSNAYHNKWIFLTGTLAISLFASCQIISAGYVAPYNLNATIQYQAVPTAIGFPTTRMLLDRTTNQFFLQINQIAVSHGFKPGDDIMAFSDMPGIVFALGGRSPVVPWFLINARLLNEWILQHGSAERLKKAFILQNASGLSDIPDLVTRGLHFPDDYVFCGQAFWPLTKEWVRLWKPKQS